ncbi:MAG: hypothetical protein GPOALKHO_000281 [Sodalis sp.]|nr:MAG: hypothetical protein GPOALKHO_000281 [Sodalis sp.]
MSDRLLWVLACCWRRWRCLSLGMCMDVVTLLVIFAFVLSER